ncbi:MAG: spore coat protein CotH [Gemmatimonadetes bacterium]|nr:spore coat protein CotH [Gemmatimonadota bacterium]
MSRVSAFGAVALCALLSACRKEPTSPTADPDRDTPSVQTAQQYNPDWTDATHGNVPPNYAAVFPQSSVNTIEITMTAAQWTAIRTNMRALWGFDFGVGGMGPGGGGFPSTDPDYQGVTLRFNGKAWKNVGFRLKGNSSLSTAWRQGNYKLPFRLNFDKFEDQFPATTNQHFNGFKELSMSPAWADNSLIREKLTADIFRMAGIPSAQTAFYRVFIDFGAGLKYCGVYTAVEVIDDSMVQTQFGSDAGNIYKPESRFDTFVQAQFEKKNNEAAADWSDVRAAITALQSPLRTTNAAQWRTALEATFNVDHFLRWLAINNTVVNWDSYGAIAHNYYLYNHPTNKLTWIPWDHNQAMTGTPGVTGTALPAGNTGPNTRGLSMTMNEVANSWPLLRYLANDSVYFARYKAHVRAFVDGVLTDARLTPLIDQYTALISPFVVGANGEQPGYTYLASPNAFLNAAATLKAHITARRTVANTFLQ